MLSKATKYDKYVIAAKIKQLFCSKLARVFFLVIFTNLQSELVKIQFVRYFIGKTM